MASLVAVPCDVNRAQCGDAPYRRWRRVRDLLREADAQRPLDDLEEELLTAAQIVLCAADAG